MFVDEEDLPDDVDSLKALVMDLSRRLQNSQHTIAAERKASSQAIQQAELYRSRLLEVESGFRIEAARIRNTDMKVRREKDAKRYEENKIKSAALVEELRIAELDAQIAGITKTVPIKIARLRARVGSLEEEQQSLRLMLSQLSDIEALNEKLVVASQMGDIAHAITLLQAGADVNYVDAAGYLPIHYACKDGHRDLVHLLLQHGSDFNARLTGHCPIVIAARRGHIDIVRILLENGANVEEKGSAGYPALISALMHDRISTVHFLIEQAGAQVNSMDSDENTALHHAVRSENPHALEMIRYLLDNGADVTMVNRRGQNPLQIALYEKRKAAVEVITGVKEEVEESDPQRGRSGEVAQGRRGSMMVFTPVARPGRFAAGSGAAASKLRGKPPVNAVPKHKRAPQSDTPPVISRKTKAQARPPMALSGLTKGSALDGIGEDGLEAIREESTTSQILSPEGPSFIASTSVASSITFDPE